MREKRRTFIISGWKWEKRGHYSKSGGNARKWEKMCISRDFGRQCEKNSAKLGENGWKLGLDKIRENGSKIWEHLL